MKNEFQYSKDVARIPLIFVFVMWFVYWFEIKFQMNFTNYGVYPRTISGLKGVVCSPFIHGGIKHLFNNTIPIAVFLSMLFYFYKEVAAKVLLFGVFLSGFLTWCIGVSAYHIGMSGVIYVLFSFIFFSGILRKHYRLIAVSLIVIFLYGSMIWYVFPVEEGISWEGHLSGFISGLLLAIVYRKVGPQKIKYQYRKDEFDTWFDEDGNFNPPKPPEVEENMNSEL